MDEISWFNDVYSDMFSLIEFDNLFNAIDFESFESKENDSGTRVSNNTSYFESATCAHRDNFGNKQLTSAGWVQVSSNF